MQHIEQNSFDLTINSNFWQQNNYVASRSVAIITLFPIVKSGNRDKLEVFLCKSNTNAHHSYSRS